MKMITTRFGEIDIDETKTIEMKGGGILGFERLVSFALVLQDEKTPFLWLQSLEDGSVAFVVINSFVALPDYGPVIDGESQALLEIEKPEDALLLSIVTIRSNPFRVTVNLKAPLVVNVKTRRAKQIVVDTPDYPVRHDLALKKPAAGEAQAPVGEMDKVRDVATGSAGL
jgi:flagellar assembly factor FliW